MKIKPKTSEVVIPISNLGRIYDLLIDSIRAVRKAHNLPMNKYQRSGLMNEADHAQYSLIEIGELLNMDMGVESPTRGCELDVRNKDEM